MIADGNRALHQYRSSIGLGGHEVDSSARDLDSGPQRLSMRIQPRKTGQQRGMDVEHSAVPALDELGREQPHEAGETDQLDPPLVQRRLQHGLEACAILAERLALDHQGRNAALLCPLQARRVGAVGDHHGNLGRKVACDRGAVDMWGVLARLVLGHGVPFGCDIGLVMADGGRIGWFRRDGVLGAREPDFLAA